MVSGFHLSTSQSPVIPEGCSSCCLVTGWRRSPRPQSSLHVARGKRIERIDAVDGFRCLPAASMVLTFGLEISDEKTQPFHDLQKPE